MVIFVVYYEICVQNLKFKKKIKNQISLTNQKRNMLY